MPKVKTSSTCKKRFRKNSSGKIKRARAYRRHHAWAKGSKKARKLRINGFVDKTQEKKIASILPY